uniref:hypothetical protein n=1 Tax=Polaromonas sp. W5N TaxID=1840315 RepID=UPI0015E803C9|nr:hypothetical protein [Polaromonas sp. W5N]
MVSVIKKPQEAQDHAAGGEQMRKIKFGDGRVATASVSVQLLPRSNQKWGYLRFKTDGKTKQFYIGKVSAETLEESLAIGWHLAREKDVLERRGWSWVVPLKKEK